MIFRRVCRPSLTCPFVHLVASLDAATVQGDLFETLLNSVGLHAQKRDWRIV
jgi:hypothetical protein